MKMQCLIRDAVILCSHEFVTCFSYLSCKNPKNSYCLCLRQLLCTWKFLFIWIVKTWSWFVYSNIITTFKIMAFPIRQYVMIVLKGSIPIAFGGTEEPAAYGELVSIGGLNANVNKKLSAAVAEILETKLSVPKSRFFLKFYDTKGSFFGWNGSTF